jgi:hypothetical protein
MLTLQHALHNSSAARANSATFFLTRGWLNQNSKTNGILTMIRRFRPVYGCCDIAFHAAAGASMYADM